MSSFVVNKGFCSILLLLILCVRLTKNASLSLSEQKKYKNLIEGQGLYSTDDDVETLTANNFNSKLYGQSHAWFIEFYNSWCGFCQRFAPSWKALATDIKGWKTKVAVGAMDCSDDDNSVICREFEVMGYPTLRYFHENYQQGSFGDYVVKGEDVHSHRRNLTAKLIEEQNAGRGQIFPNLLPYTHPDKSSLFTGVPPTTKFIFLILEGNSTTYGAEVAMDLHRATNIVIRYSPANNTELLSVLGITELPSMIVFSDDGTFQHFTQVFLSRKDFRNAIKEFMSTRGLQLPDEIKSNDEIYTGKWIDTQIPDMALLMEAREFLQLKEKVKRMGDVVFQMDLETALRYSLKHEVANVKILTGEKLEALKAYLSVLAKYFPLGRKGKVFLSELRDSVSSKSSVRGSEIGDALSRVEGEDQKVFSSPKQWLACRGSTLEKRGYPCGVWKMFHYLTVNAAENSDAEPLEVLGAMLKYVKHFFGCADCSRHFQQMAVDKDMSTVSSVDSSVLWLWMAHNTVNKRLAGDETEDPEFPKVQFPSSERCPECRNADGSWNYPRLLTYIKHMYSNINVRYIGSDTRVLHMGLDGYSDVNSSSIASRIDSSMCLLLYVASFALMVVLIRIFLKRGYRKKTYVHDLLGKV